MEALNPRPEDPRHTLYILAPAPASDDELRLGHAAAAFGIQPEIIEVDGPAGLTRGLARVPGTASAVAIPSQLLTERGSAAIAGTFSREHPAAHWLVYGARCPDLLAPGNVPAPTKNAVPQTYRFPDGAAPWVGPLAGLDFQRTDPGGRPVPFFDQPTDPHLAVLMTAGDSPVFMAFPQAARVVYFWATTAIPDVAASLPDDKSLQRHYPGLLPILIFLKRSFGAACWHAARPCARLIIDDPLVRASYGFLRYDELLASMSRHGYGTTVAFIPWNHRRTSRRVAHMLAQRAPRFSLCVHGRDHTNREFASIGEEEALHKGLSALERMRRHEQTYGLAWDPVMVFPQGLFSVAALRGLQRAGFSAAINTTCVPASGAADALTLADVMAPAVTRYHGFPVFPRRYPVSLIDFAFDLLVGKAALIVEHHDGLRDGYAHLETFISRLHAMEPALQWPDLETLVTSSCRQRILDSTADVVFYTRRFRWTNPVARPLQVRFGQHQPGRVTVRQVAVDAIASHFRHEGDWLELEFMVAGGQTVEIEVACQELPAPAATGDALGYRLSVLMRRALSELRDNVLSRNPALLNLAQRMAGAVKATGKA